MGQGCVDGWRVGQGMNSNTRPGIGQGMDTAKAIYRTGAVKAGFAVKRI